MNGAVFALCVFAIALLGSQVVNAQVFNVHVITYSDTAQPSCLNATLYRTYPNNTCQTIPGTNASTLFQCFGTGSPSARVYSESANCQGNWEETAIVADQCMYNTAGPRPGNFKIFCNPTSYATTNQPAVIFRSFTDLDCKNPVTGIIDEVPNGLCVNTSASASQTTTCYGNNSVITLQYSAADCAGDSTGTITHVGTNAREACFKPKWVPFCSIYFTSRLPVLWWR